MRALYTIKNLSSPLHEKEPPLPVDDRTLLFLFPCLFPLDTHKPIFDFPVRKEEGWDLKDLSQPSLLPISEATYRESWVRYLVLDDLPEDPPWEQGSGPFALQLMPFSKVG